MKTTFVMAILLLLAGAATAAEQTAVTPEMLGDLKAAPKTHECVLHTLSCNSTVADTINIFGCDDAGTYYNVHRIFLNANTRFRVSGSASYSATLGLFFEEGDDTLLAFGGSIDYTARQSTWYWLLVVPNAKLVTGPYTLVTTCATATSTACTANSTTLCLNNNRFAVSVAWRNGGQSGNATAVPMTADTGHFWFFNSANVEVVLKVLGPTESGRYWVFFGALSNLEYTVTVRDTQTGRVKTYVNPNGQFASIGDTNAF